MVVLPMVRYNLEIYYRLKNAVKKIMGVYALKSTNCILFLDMIGTFFAFIKKIYRCRSPPSINLD